MPISDLNRQLILIQRIGDIDAISADPISPLTPGSSGIVLQNAERIWQLHEPILANFPAQLGQTLFDYYFMRTGVQIVMGVLESRVDFSAIGTAMSVRLNQRLAARQMQIERYSKEIERLEHKLEAFAPAAFGLIKRIEPITPPVPGELSSPLAAVGAINVWVLDASDPHYQGSPYWRRAFSPTSIR